MEKIIQSLINNWVKGVNTYTHNGSTWLIFTDSKKWVIELTVNKTLWYNYNFFKQIFEFMSLDVVDNQDYITKWVEDNIINKVKEIKSDDFNVSQNLCEDVIENGIKKTISLENCGGDVNEIINNGVTETDYKNLLKRGEVEDTIKNGVKEITYHGFEQQNIVDDTLENGVKVTSFLQSREYTGDIDEALQKGVKRTIWAKYTDPDRIDEVVEGGIKNTNGDYYTDPNQIDEIINNGIKEIKKLNENVVKETSHRRFLKTYDVKDTIQDGTENDYWVLDGCDTPVDEVIENGIEEIYEVDWDVPNYVIEEVISVGVKNSNPLQYMPKEIIDNVVENGITSTHDDIYHHRGRVDGVIKNGIKETRREICEYKETVEYIIQTGIKETKVCNYTDPETQLMWVKWGNQIDEVIENGVKETEPQDDWVNTNRIVTEVIDEGIKKPTD